MAHRPRPVASGKVPRWKEFKVDKYRGAFAGLTPAPLSLDRTATAPPGRRPWGRAWAVGAPIRWTFSPRPPPAPAPALHVAPTLMLCAVGAGFALFSRADASAVGSQGIGSRSARAHRIGNFVRKPLAGLSVLLRLRRQPSNAEPGTVGCKCGFPTRDAPFTYPRDTLVHLLGCNHFGGHHRVWFDASINQVFCEAHCVFITRCM